MNVPDSLFCPICGNAIQKRGDYWYCERGEMSFSKEVQKNIIEAISSIPSTPFAASSLPQRRWGFCPRCGQHLAETPQKRGGICPSCNISLHSGIFFMLSEYHHHKDSLLYIGDPAHQHARAKFFSSIRLPWTKFINRILNALRANHHGQR